MPKGYRPYLPDQDLLLPPSLREWVAEEHLVYFVSDVVDQLSVAAKKGTILAAMAVTGPQPSNWSLSLLIGRLVQNGPESVKGAPLLGAAKRTLDGEDRSEIVT